MQHITWRPTTTNGYDCIMVLCQKDLTILKCRYRKQSTTPSTHRNCVLQFRNLPLKYTAKIKLSFVLVKSQLALRSSQPAECFDRYTLHSLLHQELDDSIHVASFLIDC